MVQLEQLGWTPARAFFWTEHDPGEWLPGRVSRVDRGGVLLHQPSGECLATWRSPICVIDGATVAQPAIGDWCLVSPRGDHWQVELILPRTTAITRAVAHHGRAAQVLAANVDVGFVVTGLDQDFSLRRIERYLALLRSGGVRPVLVLNKADLCEAVEERCAAVARIAPGALVLPLVALDSACVGQLAGQIPFGQTAVFLGSSGAGKSTLLNGLLGEARQAIAPVRDSDDTGKHTTTRRELFMLPQGGAVIDTPGLREVGVLVDTSDLDRVFVDIKDLAAGCRFADCVHEHEPGCAVIRAAQEGRLDPERLASWTRLRREAEQANLRRDAYAHRQQEKRTIGRYRKHLREINRFKGRT